MQTRLTFLALIIACLTLAACDDADDTVDTRTAGEKVADAGEKAGDALNKAAAKTGEVAGKITDDAVTRAKDAKEQTQRASANAVPSDAEAIHDVIAQLAEAAMKPGQLADVVDRLAEGDRTRLGEYAKAKHPDLSNVVGGRVAAAWRKAYGHAFDINDETGTFAGSPITLGGDGKSATMLMADLKVPFLREPAGWRIDAPDTLSGEALKNALMAQLDAIAGSDTPLPKDESEGHRRVAHLVLKAILTSDQPRAPVAP